MNIAQPHLVNILNNHVSCVSICFWNFWWHFNHLHLSKNFTFQFYTFFVNIPSFSGSLLLIEHHFFSISKSSSLDFVSAECKHTSFTTVSIVLMCLNFVQWDKYWPWVLILKGSTRWFPDFPFKGRTTFYLKQYFLKFRFYNLQKIKYSLQ